MTVRLDITDLDGLRLDLGTNLKLVLLADGEEVAVGAPQADGTVRFDADPAGAATLAVRADPA
jgi:hypothetical protein